MLNETTNEPTNKTPKENKREIDPWDLLEKMLDAGGDTDLDLEEAIANAETEPVSESVASATKFLELLVKGGGLELEEGIQASEIAKDFADVLAEGDAEDVADWLLDHDGVADLFATDDQLEKLVQQW